jgi:hypothetical protein
VLEDRNYLLSLLALLLLALNLGSWPLLYLLLQSYVPEWHGVMCIYGVMRIGEGSAGSSRFLPGLLATLQSLKPLVVLGSGAWFVLYLVNRRTQTGPLLGRTLLALVVCGVLTLADAAVELAYLFIPKKEVVYSTGCCSGVFEDRSGLWGMITAAVGGPSARPWLHAANHATALAMAAALFVCGRLFGIGSAPAPSSCSRCSTPGTAEHGPALRLVSAPARAEHGPALRRAGLLPLLVGACVTLVAGLLFLVEVVAPTLLQMPGHHCPYDLISAAPEGLLGFVLLVAGAFLVGWACVAGWFARCPQTEPFVGNAVAWLLFLGGWCYLGSVGVTIGVLAMKG